MSDPTLSRILVYPVKSLDPVAVEAATVREAGGLSVDREYAIVDADGEYVNGKRERQVHRLASSFDPETGALTLGPREGDERATFRLPDERATAADWLSSFFGYDVALKRDDRGGFPDDTHAAGPTVIAAATLEAVAGWFDDIDAAGMRRRLRPNLVVSGVEAFWEDRLYADRDSVVAFDVGGARFEGVNPCQRCVVPTRDPDTGADTEGFRERFVERRAATLPGWADRDWFDHHFRLMVNSRVPRETVGDRVAVDDAVTVRDRRDR
ncbi:MOSC domain-containing protein [Halorarius halobius]|uniref:MOSC domain-containing protein n=1 Tax=Halorarius halobius TaxID=2962671 RepID=UPI0020CFBC23|nr:MOSC N-terminal beta barrel domain-containing protein [Halorarius halobius]